MAGPMTTTMTSREFNRDVSRAKRAASHGPVFITDRGRPAHVLLTVEAYSRIADAEAKIGELVGMAEAAGIDFDPPRLVEVTRPADFS